MWEGRRVHGDIGDYGTGGILSARIYFRGYRKPPFFSSCTLDTDIRYKGLRQEWRISFWDFALSIDHCVFIHYLLLHFDLMRRDSDNLDT